MQCLSCKKFEVNSNAPTTVPCPTSKHTENLNIQPSKKIWKVESDGSLASRLTGRLLDKGRGRGGGYLFFIKHLCTPSRHMGTRVGHIHLLGASGLLAVCCSVWQSLPNPTKDPAPHGTLCIPRCPLPCGVGGRHCHTCHFDHPPSRTHHGEWRTC